MNWLFEFYNIHTGNNEIAIYPGDTWQQAWLEIVIMARFIDIMKSRSQTVIPILRIEPYG